MLRRTLWLVPISIIILLPLGVLSYSAAVPEQPRLAPSELTDGDAQYKARDYKQAALLYQQALRSSQDRDVRFKAAKELQARPRSAFLASKIPP